MAAPEETATQAAAAVGAAKVADVNMQDANKQLQMCNDLRDSAPWNISTDPIIEQRGENVHDADTARYADDGEQEHRENVIGRGGEEEVIGYEATHELVIRDNQHETPVCKDPSKEEPPLSHNQEPFLGEDAETLRPLTRLLQYYITQAEDQINGEVCVRICASTEAPVAWDPALRKGGTNRVIVYTGCFNPPHRGHMELLSHTFLRTDTNTIAAIILPTDDHCSKAYTKTKSISIGLKKDHRIELWKDDILGRFVWAWAGGRDILRTFILKLQFLAKEDGYDIQFTYLHGADHSSILRGFRGEGTGSVISSDISRPFDFLKYTGNPWSRPEQVKGWGSWRKTLPPTPLADRKPPCDCPQWPCWICYKLESLFPEYFEEGFKDDSRKLGGDATGIIKRCHEGQGVMWRSRNPDGRLLWFLPSGREYPVDTRRNLISSTEIRRLLGTTPTEEIYEKIKDLALNPRILLDFLGLSDTGRKFNKRIQSGVEEIKDSIKKQKVAGEEEVIGAVDDVAEKIEVD